jgi:hypothetical protein
VLDLALARAPLDLAQRHVQLRLAAHHVAVVLRALVGVDAQVARVEDVAVDRQEVAVLADQDAGAVRHQPLEPAGPEHLDDLAVDLLGDLRERHVGLRHRPFRRHQGERQHQGRGE